MRQTTPFMVVRFLRPRAVLLVCPMLALFVCVMLYEHLSMSEAELEAPTKKLPIVFLAVVIFSAPNQRSDRDVVRKTWVRIQPRAFYRFFVGTGSLDLDAVRTLNDENLLFGDLVLLSNLNDSYKSLTSKLLSSLTWTSRNVEFQYVLKVDSDSFVQLQLFQPALTAMHAKHHDLLYWGYMKGGGAIRTQGKWSQSGTPWLLCDRYLPYAYGGGYVLSRTLVQFIVRNAPLLRRYDNEDVSLGTWLAGLNVQYVHDTRFDTSWRSRGCLNSFLVTHKQTAAMMLDKYGHIANGSRMCPIEVELHSAYAYDWRHPVSSCCQQQAGQNMQFFS